MNKLMCMFGLHNWTPWVEIQKVTIVAGKENQYTNGYRYYYSRNCAYCNLTEHKNVRV